MGIFFTSDTHFGHCNIITYCNRPFIDNYEMDNTIIDNWNQLVKPNDSVYHLGDFAWTKSVDQINDMIDRLNGHIILVRGNHDRFAQTDDLKFKFVTDREQSLYINVYNTGIYLSHYAHRVWDRSHYGTWHLYGHSHGTLSDDPLSLSLDVGVDKWGFTPVSFEKVKCLMEEKALRIAAMKSTIDSSVVETDNVE